MMAPSHPSDDQRAVPSSVDWESFYANYRKPGYLPGYEILQKLGAGAFGVVFKARKQSIGKDYAVKFLRVEDEQARADVLRELEVIRHFAQLDHPNLVAIEDRGVVDGIPYIVMGYAGDETLRTRLDRGALPRGEALAVFQQVARAVQALHDHSLVHFDLKPANVYLRGDVARVGDYGLSRVVTRSHNSLSFGRGTPYYMAPELLRRRGDHRSDVYSLGVMLFECLTGSVPFRGDSEWEVLRKHESEAPEWPRSLEPRDREVLARALAKAPAERFASVAEMVDALLEAPVPAAAVTAAAEPSGWRDRATRRAHTIGHGARSERGRSFCRMLMMGGACFLLLSFCARATDHSRQAWGSAWGRHVAMRANVHAPAAPAVPECQETVAAVAPDAPAVPPPEWPAFVAGVAADVLDWLGSHELFDAQELARLRRICDSFR